ncbi:cytochrome P450 6k1-like isoform X2 [Pectinophora gossypiella]|uniref:cytochrome P450 6k1-like isoform X2 n=1 Tax=Pectinophora gossypiella TaxID=13191 RepID=UPI00214E120D|nr:cytochrome P450 6k1-like isoform X2 [Pectinophora gossypiella]
MSLQIIETSFSPLAVQSNDTIKSKWMIAVYNKYKHKTPYVGIWLFWRPALIVNDPEIGRRVLVKDADVFRDRFLNSGKSDPIGCLNIFSVNDPTWSRVRRHLTPVFTTAKIKHIQNLIAQKSKELVQRIQIESSKNKLIDIRTMFADFSTDIIGTAAFGVKCNATLTGKDPMRSVTKSFQTYSFIRGLNFVSIMFFPELADIFRFSFFPKSATDYFTKIFRAVVKERGGYDKPVEEIKDLLDTLLKMKQNAAKESDFMSEELLIAQATIFVQGAFETSSNTLAVAIYELAYNTEVQEKLYREIVDIKERLGGEDFTVDALADATYLNCVIDETLRKYPPMGWLDRVARKEYQIDENLTIPAGTPVYVNFVGMQVDPDYYPEPQLFKPERFLPEAKGDLTPFTYAPFGEGPRNCIGRRFGQQTVRFGLASVILNYELKPLPNMPLPNDIEFNKNAPFLLVELLHVNFVPRH